MNDEMDVISRRWFITAAGGTAALGAGMILGSSSALGKSLKPTRDQPYSSAWDNRFYPLSTKPLYPPRQAPRIGEKVHEFDIDLSISVHEIVPGIQIHAFTYNKTYPGPEIRVPEGDWVLVNFTNRTSEFHTIHWHGIMLANEMDGVPNGTQWGVGPNQTFKYLFRAQPAGTPQRSGA